jgi:cell wall-associated NlpC family hydrolase
MCGRDAFRSGHSRRGLGHDAGQDGSRLSLCALIAALALSACANAPRSPDNGAAGAPIAKIPASSAQRSADPRTLMIDSATAMLGQPYRWGGAGPGGFDCSGLVVYAAGGAGIHVPRTTHEQRNFGIRVSRRELLPGDLVFMHLEHKELHVGIALDGERFIHAPSSGGRVRIDSLGASPYASAFVTARRVIPAP